MTDKQPEALRLANVCSNLTRYSMDAHLIAAELRRLHTESEMRRVALLDEMQKAALAAGQATAAQQSGAKLNYFVLYVYASQHGIDYNSLCAAVHEAIDAARKQGESNDQ